MRVRAGGERGGEGKKLFHMGWLHFSLLGLYPLPEEELGLSQEH